MSGKGWRQVAGLAALAVLLGGCAALDDGDACPAIGLASGFAVLFEKASAGGDVPSAVEVWACQDGLCREGRVELHGGTAMTAGDCEQGPQDTVCSAMASPDGSLVGFWDEQSFSPGAIHVGVGAAGLGPMAGTVTAREISIGSGACRITGFQALLRISEGQIVSSAP